MLRKVFSVLALSLIALSFVACGAGKYSDVKDTLTKMTAANESFVAGVKAANDGPAVAKAINDFAAALVSSKKDFEAIQTKYPELKSSDDQTPAELKEVSAKFKASGEGLGEAMKKIANFATDKDVMKAQEALMNAFKAK